jgi:hypothetical protein
VRVIIKFTLNTFEIYFVLGTGHFEGESCLVSEVDRRFLYRGGALRIIFYHVCSALSILSRFVTAFLAPLYLVLVLGMFV